MKPKPNNIWAIVKKILLSHLPLSISLFCTILGAVVIGILPPLVLEQLVNTLTAGKPLSLFLIFSYVALLALAGIFDAGKEGLITLFGQKVTHGIRSEMCQKLSALPASYYTENETGIITSRFVNDVDTVETLFNSGIISMVADGCKVISILIIIFVKSKGLGLLILLVTPVLMLLTLAIQKKMLRAQLENRIAVGKANQHIPETIQSIRMIHSFDSEPYMEKIYGSYISDGYKAVEKSNFYDAIYSPIIITISAVMISVLMIFSSMGGGFQSFFGMSVGTAVAVIGYVSKVFDPLESIGIEIQNIQSAVAGIFRINEFLSETDRQNTEQTHSFEKNVPAIRFHNVSFGYSNNQEILHRVCFEVVDQETVTLIGRTGAGKSTAFKLLLGMYEVWSGEITLYGVPVREISDTTRAKMIGYVEQSFHMIPGTIRDQITLKDETVSTTQVWHVLEIVGLKQQIFSLDAGLDTPCSESLFSQGQLQLLSIARAIVHNPPVLLLDEITSNLDSLTEKQVLQALKEASANRTVLSISHRIFKKSEINEHSRCISL